MEYDTQQLTARMNYSDFLTGISFRFIKPKTRMPRRLARLLNKSSRLGIPLEQWITTLLEEDGYMKRTLNDLCKVPKMSSFAMGAIIHRGVSLMPKDQAFVNVGVWHGFTFLCGMINNPD